MPLRCPQQTPGPSLKARRQLPPGEQQVWQPVSAAARWIRSKTRGVEKLLTPMIDDEVEDRGGVRRKSCGRGRVRSFTVEYYDASQMSLAASREGLTDGSRHATRGWSASRAMRLAGLWRSTWLAGSARGVGDPTLHSSIIAASLSVHPSMAPPSLLRAGLGHRNPR